MIRTGIGFDVHPFADGRRLVLGGVEIAGARGLAGHSDADVLCHALADALLGAVAYGDIGVHFPDSDLRWKDADSLQLLTHCAQMVRARDAQIINVDATVLAEYPKLAPHRELMRERLAAALQLPLDRISIKATTMEKLGSIGRGEGIAVIAIATVEQST